MLVLGGKRSKVHIIYCKKYRKRYGSCHTESVMSQLCQYLSDCKNSELYMKPRIRKNLLPKYLFEVSC